MPTKYPPRDRTWGTRYDTLGSSPLSSPPSKQPQTPSNTPVTSLNVNTTAQNPQHSMVSMGIPGTPAEKMPHDASVFVGSLPTHVEHSDLTRLLHEHVSQYAEIKTVKVIRDSKGGTCAFVQCQDASAAATLIQTLQTVPQRPFFGRLLRYEPARAFRALLISYKRMSSFGTHHALNEHSDTFDRDPFALPLPVAIRLCRPRGSRHWVALYDADARDFALNNHSSSIGHGVNNSPYVEQDPGVLIDPIEFDETTLLTLVKAFGAIEHFELFTPQKNDLPENPVDDMRRSMRHDTTHVFAADIETWQIKWCHRDDCLNAFGTLRNIPFLDVTWAHHATPQLGVGFVPRRVSPNVSPIHEAQSSFSTLILKDVHQRSTSGGESDIAFGDKLNTELIHGFTSQTKLRSSSSQGHVPGWSGNTIRIAESVDRLLLLPERDTRPWGDREMDDDLVEDLRVDFATLASPSSSLSMKVPNADRKSYTENDIGHSGLRSPPLSPVGLPSTQINRDALETVSRTSEASFPCSPLTPKTSHSLLPTPTSSLKAREQGFRYGTHDRYLGGSSGDASDSFKGIRRDVDPNAVFVGGLDMHGETTWDEPRLYAIFSRFGTIEHIQLVRPANKPSAFAFIKFKEADAAARAVEEVHNSLHDGRQLRVQLRENHPSHRSPWRQSRYKGRQSSGPFRYDDDNVRRQPHFNNHREGREVGLERRPNPLLVPPSHGHHNTEFTGAACPNSLSAPPFDNTESGRKFSDNSGSGQMSLSSSATKPSRPDVPDYAATAATPAPSVSSVGPSASAVGGSPHYAVPPVGYYAPQTWYHSTHPPPYSYHVPFLPHFAGVPAPFVAPGAQAHPAQEPAHQNQPAWTNAGNNAKAAGPHMPYNHPSTSAESYPTQGGVQPPLKATGFIQGEHGMLIPVYQPEALHQYMSSSDHPQGPPTQVPSQASVPTWAPYPHYPMYTYPMPIASMPPSQMQQPQQVQTAQQPYWAVPPPGYPGLPVPVPHATSVQPMTGPSYLASQNSSGSLSSMAHSRGGYPGPQAAGQPGYHHNVSPARRFPRHEQIGGGTGQAGHMPHSHSLPNRLESAGSKDVL